MAVTSRPAGRQAAFAVPDFRFLFAAAGAGRLGVQVGNMALPLVAAVALAASEGQVGLLAALTTAAFLVIGLPAGVWVDRLRRRPVMITADLARAALLAWVPAAWWLQILTVEQLYVVAMLAGVGTVFYDVAAQSLLPRVVGRDRLLGANSALGGLNAVTSVAGPAGGGGLVAVLTAPFAVIATASGLLCSAVLLRGVRRREPPPAPADRGRGLVAEVGDGLRYVATHPVLRPALLQGALANLSIQMAVVMLPFLFTRDLGLSAGVLGLFLAAGGVGSFLGAVSARRVADRIGAGRAVWLLGIAVAPVGLVVPLVDAGPMLWVSGAAWAAVTFKVGVDNVLLVSFRQRVTPDRLLGRVNASYRTVLIGALTVGAGLAGGIGEAFGARAALWAAAAGLAVVWVPVYFSALRTMRTLPEPAEPTEP
jgi:MFS family permease